jgi:peptidoglycan/LPS O-acetylase OafA/YrhL
MTYRPEIDGLRALAVVLVLLFHARVPYAAGGFVGVDVFFVISGYLITGQILSEHAKGRFSIVAFYERRLRRILPAYVVVVLVTLVIGGLLLMPREFETLGKSAFAATVFLSNVYFWKRADYFHDDSRQQVLIHTWSLSVEEQFYIVFPVVMGLLLLWRRQTMALILGAVGLGSLLLSQHWTATDPGAAFYASPSRAWELLLGALLALGNPVARLPPPLRTALAVAGLGLVIWAAATIEPHGPFPGLQALGPCIGTALVIAAATSGSGPGRALAMPPLVKLGLVSYPLYLWHWPLLVMAGVAAARELAPYEIAALYAVALLLAVLTWRFVETPIRSRRRLAGTRRATWISAGAATLVTGLAGLAVWSQGGFPGRLPESVGRAIAEPGRSAHGPEGCQGLNLSDPVFLRQCSIGDSARADFEFAVWGDSIAGNLASVIGSLAKERGVKGLQIGDNGCPPLIDTRVELRGAMTECAARNGEVLPILRASRIRHVVLIGQWGWYSQGKGFKTEAWPVRLYHGITGGAVPADRTTLESALTHTVDTLRRNDIRVTIIGPVPEVGWYPAATVTLQAQRLKAGEQETTWAEFAARQERVFSTFRALVQTPGTHVLYPHELLCDTSSSCHVTADGMVLYADPEHLTWAGVEYLRPIMRRIW